MNREPPTSSDRHTQPDNNNTTADSIPTGPRRSQRQASSQKVEAATTSQPPSPNAQTRRTHAPGSKKQTKAIRLPSTRGSASLSSKTRRAAITPSSATAAEERDGIASPPPSLGIHSPDSPNPRSAKRRHSEDAWVNVSPTRIGKAVKPPSELPFQPEAWAACEADLNEAMPNICLEPNSVIQPFEDAPLLYVRGQSWEGDGWSHEKHGVLLLTLARQRTGHRPIKRRRLESENGGTSPQNLFQSSPQDQMYISEGQVSTDEKSSHPKSSTAPDSLNVADLACSSSSSRLVSLKNEKYPKSLSKIHIHGDEWYKEESSSFMASEGIVEIQSLQQLLDNHSRRNNSNNSNLFQTNYPLAALAESFEYFRGSVRRDPPTSSPVLGPQPMPVNDFPVRGVGISPVGDLEMHDMALIDEAAPFFTFQDPAWSIGAISNLGHFQAVGSVEEHCPPDVQLLRLANQSGTPVRILANRDWDLLPEGIPEKCTIAFLGFFMVTEEESNQDEAVMRYRFRFQWHAHRTKTTLSAGGMDEHHPDRSIRPLQPLPSHMQDLELIPYSLTNPPPPNAHSRFCTGWWCDKCGKINVRTRLSRWVCTDCLNKGNDEPPLDASSTRRTFRPLIVTSSYPKSVVHTSQAWDDGLVTYEFCVQNAVLKHITHRAEGADRSGADEIFELLQKGDTLKRDNSGTTKFVMVFSYHHSQNIPSCGEPFHDPLKRPKDYMFTRGYCYGEDERLSSPTAYQTDVYAWVPIFRQLCTVPAKDRFCISKTLDARNRPTLLMCLGADMSLELRPHGSLPSSDLHLSDNEGDRVAFLRHGNTHSLTESSWPSRTNIPTSEPQAQNLSNEDERSKFRRPKLADRQIIRVVMTHGDVVHLDGDIYDCAFHRNGFSMLLIIST